jgi:hypothetical protein
MGCPHWRLRKGFHPVFPPDHRDGILHEVSLFLSHGLLSILFHQHCYWSLTLFAKQPAISKGLLV